jgi:hypothetical protein
MWKVLFRKMGNEKLKLATLSVILPSSVLLQWKWFLSEFLNNHKIMAKRKTPLWVEEIASAPMVPCPITMPTPWVQKGFLLGFPLSY